MLAKIRRYIPTFVAVLLYKSLVLSKLNYGNVLCTGASKVAVSRLQKLQNKALRICYCANRYTSNLELHTKAGVLPIILRRKLDLYKIMYNRALLKERSLPPDVNSPDVNSPVFEPNYERPLTRYATSRPPTFVKPKTSRFLDSVTYQGPKIWADLPSHAKVLSPGLLTIEFVSLKLIHKLCTFAK